MSNQFASGKNAHSFCDVCGFRYPLRRLKELVQKTKKTNIMACPECWVPDQPQLQLGMYPIQDPQALRNPRVDVSLTDSENIWWGWNPVYSLYQTGSVGSVTISV